MRMAIPQFANKSDLFDYLRANKKQLLAEKCLKPIKHNSSAGTVSQSKVSATKAMVEAPKEGELNVSIIGNTFNWCDNQQDVLFSGCATKTIKESGVKGKDLIYHLKDHDTSTDDRVGYLTDIYEQEFALSVLGLNMVGSTTCLVFDSLVKESLSKKLFIQYKDGKVKQHSIGLQYIKLFLCIDDPNDQEHFANWNKYFQYVLNKEAITSVGYFWAVTEIRLFEVSAVLWGANELTPTIETETKNEPTKVTQDNMQPTEVTSMIGYIKSKQFFNN